MTDQVAETSPTRRLHAAEQELTDVRTRSVVSLYRTALQRLIGRPIHSSFELLVLRSVVDSVVTLRRHGVRETDSCVATAARHALARIEQRCDPAGPFEVLPEERTALDELLRVHEIQMSSEGLSMLLLAQSAKDRIGARTTGRGSTGVGRTNAERRRSRQPENAHA